jgi:hypothetical protein
MTGPAPATAVDAKGNAIIDPTKNVLDLVAAAIQRQDDLREAALNHTREISVLRSDYDEKLRKAESARIDAIRAVDVGAVNRAAEVSAVAATALAAQVQASAEALRTQVAATATAAAVALAATATAASVALAAEIEPLKKDIADLRRAQYEAQGVKANVGESKGNQGLLILAVGVAAAFLIGIINIFLSLRGG